jgi:uncharacterized membrane protein YphA (DoxX/SURF4 family)
MHNTNDAAILLARLFLTALFLTFGWRKLTDYSGTVDQMVRGRYRRVHAAPGDNVRSLHAGDVTHGAPLLGDEEG